MNRKPTVEQINSGLNLAGFGSDSNVTPLQPTDPIVKTPISQDITELDFYDFNPRLQKNPKYEEIKASIRQTKGIDNPLAVTRRPDAERRMVFSGGNTRLHALKELYEEFASAEDESRRKDASLFRYVPVVFHPWQTESRTHIAHLIENDQRSPLSLVDKARGIHTQWRLWEEELGQKIKQVDFLRMMNEAGFPLSQSSCSRLIYVADTLLSVIPETLARGLLGPRDIDEIRTIRKAYVQLWEAHEHSADSFDPTFFEALSTCDGERFSTQRLKKTLDQRIANLLEMEVIGVRHHVDAILSENAKTSCSRVSSKADDQASAVGTTQPPSSPARNEPEQDQTNDHAMNLTGVLRSQENAAGNDVGEIRKDAYRLSHKLAIKYQLGPTSINQENFGFGFSLDLPDRCLGKTEQISLWWTLLALSGQDSLDRLGHLSEDNMFRIMREGDRPDDIKSLVGETPILSNQFPLIAQIDDEAFVDFMVLIATCRRISQLSVHAGLSLWQ